MPRLLQTELVAAWVSETEEEGCGVTGPGGSPGQLGLPAGLGRKGQLVGEASTGNAGAAEPPRPVCDLRGRVPRGAGSSVALAGGLGARTALPVAESATRGHSARPPGKRAAVSVSKAACCFYF